MTLEANVPNNLFSHILLRIIPNMNRMPTNTYTYSEEYPPNFDFINEHFFKCTMTENKFDALYQLINNAFLNTTKHNECLRYFCKAQKTYWALKRFFYHTHIKPRLIKYDCQTDLMLNPLSSISDKLKISLVQSTTIYTFYINDIIRIINTSLLYAPEIFSDAIPPKNPYNNLPFTPANMYNIYFFIANSNKVMPHILHLYFLCDFDINRMSIEYESVIREEILKHYYDNLNSDDIYNDIIVMLRTHRRYCSSLLIHPEFDRQLVINKFQPLLHHALVYKYSYQPTKRSLSKRKISIFLRKLCASEPCFGRYLLSNIRPIFGQNNRSRYSYSANLLDETLEDTGNVNDLLLELAQNHNSIIRQQRTITMSNLINGDMEEDYETKNENENGSDGENEYKSNIEVDADHQYENNAEEKTEDQNTQNVIQESDRAAIRFIIEGIIQLQAVVRGHLIRNSMTDTVSDDTRPISSRRNAIVEANHVVLGRGTDRTPAYPTNLDANIQNSNLYSTLPRLYNRLNIIVDTPEHGTATAAGTATATDVTDNNPFATRHTDGFRPEY